MPPGSHIRKVHDAGDAEVAFTFGNGALLKIRDMARVHKSCPQLRDCTEEHVTLAWLAERRGRPIPAVPETPHPARGESRDYLIVSRLPGTVLADVWRGLSEGEKRHYASRVIEICEELASAWSSNTMTEVDGRLLGDSWFRACDDLPPPPHPKPRRPQRHL